jgi:hypothetical protein
MDEKENEDQFLQELETELLKIDELNTHIDHLFSWEEFLEQCRTNLLVLSQQLTTIESMLNAHQPGAANVDSSFHLGICWVGATAAYEGYLHKLFLNTLAVSSLRDRIFTYCKKRLDARTPVWRKMKDASEVEIRQWLTERTAPDPQMIASNLDEIFGIKTAIPDDEFCKRLLRVRNSYVHRGGGEKLTKNEIHLLTEKLNDLACC